MKFTVFLYLVFAIFAIQQVSAADEIINLLNTSKDLTLQELNILRPLFNELQKQYDYITEAIEANGKSNNLPWDKEVVTDTEAENFMKTIEELMIAPKEAPKVQYDTELPTLIELIGDVQHQSSGLTQEQRNELTDLQQIMQETLDEARTNIDNLVHRAILIESDLLKLNKPKIVTLVYKALTMLFRYSAYLRRAAYCVYSHVPQLNATLQNLNDGIDCYVYTTHLIINVQTETVNTVSTIKRNVYDLADVYKKIAAKNSIFGKLLTALLSMLRISRDVRETYSVSMKALDALENQLPGAASKSVACGKDFVETVPFMLTTLVNVTTCVTYRDTTTMDYEFLLSEAEREFDFGDLD